MPAVEYSDEVCFYATDTASWSADRDSLVFGHSEFRGKQKEVVEAAVAGK